MNKKNLLTLALILGSIVQADAASQQVQEVLATTDTRAIDQSFSQAYKPMSKMQDQAPAVTVDDSLPSANKEVFFKSVHFEGNKNISDEELRHIMAPVLGKKVSFKEVLAAVQGFCFLSRERIFHVPRHAAGSKGGGPKTHRTDYRSGPWRHHIHGRFKRSR